MSCCLFMNHTMAASLASFILSFYQYEHTTYLKHSQNYAFRKQYLFWKSLSQLINQEARELESLIIN